MVGGVAGARLPRNWTWVRRSVAGLVLASCLDSRSSAEEPLSLDQALLLARTANALLPVARLDVDLRREGVREANGRLLPRFSVEAAFRYAPPGATYNLAETVNEEQLQVFGSVPIYEGGALRAGIAAANARLSSAAARYRVAERELDFEVRSRFAETARMESEVRFRTEGIERLRRYLTGIRERRAAGQGVAADALKAEVRLATEEAALVDAQRRRDEARLVLNDLLGRDPMAALVIAPLPALEPPPAPTGEPWSGAPDLSQAAADLAAAVANIRIARAARIPRIDLSADAGLLGTGVSDQPPGDGFAHRLRDDVGASIGVSLSWTFWDWLYRPRLAAAELAERRARAQQLVVRRQARLGWERATVGRVALYRRMQVLERTLPMARDSYLMAESLYRGGAGTALEVLDAFTAWIGAENALADALFAYRVAEAQAIRWSTP